MSDYITNSKNRKLKTKILLFLSRINIGAGKLPLSGRVILLMDIILVISLFFPWVQFIDLGNVVQTYTAFSGYMGYVGYGIILSACLVPFFLLSHTKKERIRAKMPFRLSDAQAVVFVTAILLTSLIQTFIITHTIYSAQIAAQGATLRTGYTLAMTALVFILIATYFYSRGNKQLNTESYYIDHRIDDELSEYRDILDKKDDEKKKNMSLPI